MRTSGVGMIIDDPNYGDMFAKAWTRADGWGAGMS